MSLNLDLQQGTSFDWQLQALNPDDSVSMQFLSGDTLSAKLWQGDVDAAIFTPAITWLNAALAQYQISFNNADSLSLPLGVYYVEATATRTGRSAALLPLGSTVTIQAAPGASTAKPTYITVDDVRRVPGGVRPVAKLARRKHPAQLPRRQRRATRVPRAGPG